MSNRQCFVSVVTILVLAGVPLSSTYSAHGQMPGDVTRELFDQVVEATGKEYVKLRSDLLNRHDAAEVLLAQQRRSEPMSQRRWLAEILITRQREPAEWERLEKLFHDKVTVMFPEQPIIGQSKVGGPLLLAGEPLPSGDELQKRYGGGAPGIRAFYENRVLPESPLWRDLLGEIVLKGWNEPVRSSRLVTFTADDCVVQAMMVLGKLREQRIRPQLEQIVVDKLLGVHVRAVAARVLGTLADSRSVDSLTAVAENEDEEMRVRVEAMQALGGIGDIAALPALKRVSNRKDDRLADHAADAAFYGIEMRWQIGDEFAQQK